MKEIFAIVALLIILAGSIITIFVDITIGLLIMILGMQIETSNRIKG
jgi:hypothetical protein